MFGYTMPAYGRLSPADMRLYRKYYCEGCHQLRDGFGLRGATTVNYDMTFNTILLNAIAGDVLDFEGTTKKICVLQRSQADSELMRAMAAYTLILTKWELFDDKTDKPSVKTNIISSVLKNAIDKAVDMYPDYDTMVGEGFAALRDLELAGCKDARMMGNTFGRGLVGALADIAGNRNSPELENVFVELSTIVYIMDAVDDLDDDFMDGTYNPFLPDKGFKNGKDLISKELYSISDSMNTTIGSLQGSYSMIRDSMRTNVSLCDNIVYYGIPESARNVLTGTAKAKASIKNVLSNRKERRSDRA